MVIVIYALFLSYSGIWKRDGINKNVKNSLMMKQVSWIVFRVIVYSLSYIQLCLGLYANSI